LLLTTRDMITNSSAESQAVASVFSLGNPYAV
jgi:hypothetical protein